MTYRSNLFTASEIKYDQVDRNVRGSVLVNKLVYFGVLGGRAGLLVSSEEIQTDDAVQCSPCRKSNVPILGLGPDYYRCGA